MFAHKKNKKILEKFNNSSLNFAAIRLVFKNKPGPVDLNALLEGAKTEGEGQQNPVNPLSTADIKAPTTNTAKPSEKAHNAMVDAEAANSRALDALYMDKPSSKIKSLKNQAANRIKALPGIATALSLTGRMTDSLKNRVKKILKRN